jgi:serine/threonine-protein kinase
VGSRKVLLPVALGSVLLDRFRLEEVLGAGGMGIVVRATNVQDGSAVALKFVRSEHVGRSSSERLLREAAAAAQINSPHVVKVSSWGTLSDGTPYLAMELLRGESLASLLASGGPLPPATTCALIYQVCLGLRDAHGRGIVHRDLSANNLFACKREGRLPFVKILDFGLAKSLTRPSDYQTTLGPSVLGSPAYMPPEQIRHPERLDPRSDLWSLAVVTQELLTGKRPFVGRSHGDTLARILSDMPEPMSAEIDLPERVRAVLARCLRKEPGERPANVDELLRALSGATEASPFVPNEDDPESNDATLNDSSNLSPWRRLPC